MEPKDTNQDRPRVSERSTKTEIWEAYHRLLAEIEGRPPGEAAQSKSLGADTLKSLADLKVRVNQQLDSLSEGLLQDLDKLDNGRQAVNRGLRQLIDFQQEQQHRLEQEVTELRKHWHEEQAERQRQLEAADRKQQLAEVQRQLKDMAIVAIEGRGPKAAPQEGAKANGA